MNALEIERAAIVKKIEAHGTIPTTTDDHRCNLKHWMPNRSTPRQLQLQLQLNKEYTCLYNEVIQLT